MTFTPERSDAIRDELIDTVGHDLAARSPLRRWLVGAVLVLLGAGAGAGVSAAAFAASGPNVVGVPSGQPSPDLGDPIPAPAGVTPGQPIISLLGTPSTRTTSGSEDFDLPPRPDGATHLRVTITCLTPGSTSWGTDAGGNNPSGSCEADDIGDFGTSYYDFPLDDSTTRFYVGAKPGVENSLSMQYLNYVPTQFGVNASGQTYGAPVDGAASPDLTAVSGLAPDGSMVEGYVLTSSLTDFGPEWPGLPSDPDEALAWQQEREEKYPDGWDLPVYESDGITQIGVFHVQN